MLWSFCFFVWVFTCFTNVCKVGVQTIQNTWMCRSLGAQPRFPVDWHLGCISFYFYTALNPGQARTFPIISLSPLGNRESLVNNSFLRNNPKVQAELYPGSFLILSITCYLLLCPGIFVLLLIKPVSCKGNQSWIFIGRTDTEDEAPILWPPVFKKLTHWKRPWCWGWLKAGGEGDDRGWDGWMASPPWWTWVWASSGRWWWIGKPGVLQSMGSQSQTQLSNWTELTLFWSAAFQPQHTLMNILLLSNTPWWIFCFLKIFKWFCSEWWRAPPWAA